MSSIRMYLAARILNFIDFDFVSMVGLFKYSIIRLFQSGALIVITYSSIAILGWLRTSIKILFVALGSVGSTRESSFALEFSSRGICVS